TGRWSTVGLMIVAGAVALALESAMESFSIILQIGAGTGLIYILRWFWWRINAFTEITGMAVSLAIAMFFKFGYSSTGLPELNSWQQLLTGVVITTLSWMLVTVVTPPTDRETLKKFYRKIRPGGVGWKTVRDELAESGVHVETGDSITAGLKAMMAGTFLVYSAFFSTGYLLYQSWGCLAISLSVCGASAIALWKSWPSLRIDGSPAKPQGTE
ncbi:MAG: Na+:solute symporter, partial [Rhodopirellula bahusiensis]